MNNEMKSIVKEAVVEAVLGMTEEQRYNLLHEPLVSLL